MKNQSGSTIQFERGRVRGMDVLLAPRRGSGLVAAAAGYQVTLSDYEPLILDFERVNAAASKLPQVRCTLLDWLAPPEMERYDVILGAEILFREEFFQPLLGVLRRALKPDGVVYLAHHVQRRSLQPFLKMADKYALTRK